MAEPVEVSVVMPCLDAESTLGAQLEALSKQRSERSWELVVGDNGSSDGSRRVLESYRDRLPYLVVADASAHPGQAFAKNRAVEASRGEILLFCDADDEVAPDWLENMTRALEHHPAAACRIDIDQLNPAWLRRARPNPQATGLRPYTYPRYLDHAAGTSLGVRREVHDEIGGYDIAMPPLEDTDYCWRLQLAGHQIAFVPDAVVHYRYRQRSSETFRQARAYGITNVLIYKLYRDRGMPRIPPHAGILKLASLMLRMPQMVTRAGRANFLWSLGWRLGRLQGSLRHRVWAP